MPALQNFVDKVSHVPTTWLNQVDVLLTTIFGQAANNSQARTALYSDAPLEQTNGGTGQRTFAPSLFLATDATGKIIATTLPPPPAVQPTYPQSLLEQAAGVTPLPANLIFNYGDFRRYGADPTGVTPSDVAINQAISCNNDVYDAYPGGGTYLLNNPITILRQPMRIRGQGMRYGGAGAIGPAATGTMFILSAAAGPNVGAINMPNSIYGLVLDSFTINIPNATIGQLGVFAQNELRAGRILNIEVVTADQTAANNTYGMQLNGGTVFSGDVLVQGMFCDNVQRGIVLAGPCTTIKIRDCEFYGQTAAPTSFGILAGPQVMGCSVIGCTIEAFGAAGIQFTGSYISQIGNHYEQGASPTFIWTRGAGNARIWGQSFGEMFVSGAPAQFPKNNVDLCQVFSGPGNYYLDNAGFQIGLGLGMNLQPIQAQNGGFGAPTGNAIITNFNANTATPLQTAQMVAELTALLLQRGDIGA